MIIRRKRMSKLHNFKYLAAMLCISLLISSQKSAAYASVITIDNEICDDAISENAISEDAVLENVVSENESDDTVSNDSVMETTISENTIIGEDIVSENEIQDDELQHDNGVSNNNLTLEGDFIANEAGDTYPVTYKGNHLRSQAFEVLELVNKNRKDNGLGALTMNEQMLSAAELRACETILYFDHTRPDGTMWNTILPSHLNGENIAMGQSDAEAVMNSWMNSTGHRENILKESYTQIGIGAVEHNGVRYWVQVFGRNASGAATKTEDEQRLTTIYSLSQNIKPEFKQSAITIEGENTGSNQLKLLNADDARFESVPEHSCITYQSSDTGIATVSDDGRVTGISSGTATITGSIGNKSASYTVTVKSTTKPSIQLNRSSIAMDAGTDANLTATVSPSNMTNESIEWKSSAEDIVTVDSKGLITAHKKGQAIITAALTSDNSISAECSVEVISNRYEISAVADLKSPHPYLENSNDVYVFTMDGAEELYVSFSEQTAVEEGYDYIKIYSSTGTLIGRYTGNELAGKKINVGGDSVWIRLESNGENEFFGFEVTNIATEDNEEEEDISGNGDVLETDVPIDGIPKGMWIAGLEESYDYTGASIKPKVRVYDYKTLLREKTDYTIVYKNVKNAYPYGINDVGFDSTKAPTITIVGKGNYTGKVSKTFKCNPLSLSVALSNGLLSAPDITLVGNGKVQKALPKIRYSEKTLVNKKDYSITYTDGSGYIAPGTYDIKITGCGNYKDEIIIHEKIVDKSQITLMKKVSVKSITKQPYTGSEIEPILNVYKGKTLLIKDEDYTVQFSNNIEIGTATALLSGIGKYAGQKTVTFKITGYALKRAKVDNLPTSLVYTGSDITINGYQLKYIQSSKAEPQSLTENVDYTVSYKKNHNAGTAIIEFKGMGQYYGTLKKKLVIKPYDLQADANRLIEISLQTDTIYTKGGSKPEPIISFNGVELVKDRDYKLTYTNHKKVASLTDKKVPMVSITGKGNFAKSVKKQFRIDKSELRTIPSANVRAYDLVYSGKARKLKTTLTIMDTNGKALSKGTDYDKNYVYTYADTTNLVNGEIRRMGETVRSTDIIPAGTIIMLKTEGKGNYSGELTASFRIVAKSVASAKCTIDTQTYTGQAIKPGKNQIKLVLGKTTLQNSDYDIISYGNNVMKGKAYLLIRGKGNYGGTKKITFKIAPQSMKWWESM